MGTKNSYTGGGGKPGKDLRQNLEEWLDGLPDLGPPPDGDPPPDMPPTLRRDVPPLRPEQLLPALGLFRPRTGGGTVTARAVAAARRRRHGNRWRYPGRRPANGRGFVADRRSGRRSRLRSAHRQRAGAAGTRPRLRQPAQATPMSPTSRGRSWWRPAGRLPDGTIEEEEQRVVAAQVAQYVLEASADGGPPAPEEIVRETIAVHHFRGRQQRDRRHAAQRRAPRMGHRRGRAAHARDRPGAGAARPAVTGRTHARRVLGSHRAGHRNDARDLGNG